MAKTTPAAQASFSARSLEASQKTVGKFQYRTGPNDSAILER